MIKINNNNKNKCCGCEACVNICPKQAIHMQIDEFGNEYPVVDKSKCINCNLCEKVCAYRNKNVDNNPLCTYAGACKIDALIKNSSSGGIFIALATEFIKKDGIVYGCSMEIEDSMIIPKHIRVDKNSNLYKLQGSKYAKSKIGQVYKEVRKDLLNGKKVLFSGTPCQIHALLSYLDELKVKRSNLYTIDIICHGTPSTKLFQDYIKELEIRKKKKIIDLKFRDKKYNWNLLGTIFYSDGTSSPLYITESSYYQFFLEGKTYRDNCYSCRYACKNRVGDITIGDYWGIEEEHPEFLSNNGGNLNEKKGVSCIIVNTNLGEQLLKEYGVSIVLNESSFEQISRKNQQLKRPVVDTEERNEIFNEYKEKGYKGIEKFYDKKRGYKRFLYPIYHKFKEIIISLKK